MLQFFIDRKKASKGHPSISIWPSDLNNTKEVLARLSFHTMRSFYETLKKCEESNFENFIF